MWRPSVETKTAYTSKQWEEERNADDNDVSSPYLKQFITQIPMVDCIGRLQSAHDINEYASKGNHSASCFVLNLLQVEYPHWMKVSCHTPVTQTVICELPPLEEFKQKPFPNKTETVCSKHHVMTSGTACLSIKVSNQSKILRRFHSEIDRFLYQFFTDMQYSYLRKPPSQAPIHVEKHDPVSTEIVARSLLCLLLCSSGHYVNTQNMLDGHSDCGQNDSSEEDSSNLSPYNFSFGTHTGTPCPVNMFRDDLKQCRTYSQNIFQENFPQIKVRVSPKWKKYPCSFEQNDQQFFHFFDLCFYKTDHTGKLLFCSDGQHLQNCDRFQCSGKHKCLFSYCISLSEVCNSKWDCPNGDDEMKCEKNYCLGNLKCKLSQICVHILDVCDVIKDCPLGDDEAMCDLPQCVSTQCHCLHYAITCVQLMSLESLLHESPTALTGYIYIHISESLKHFPLMFIEVARHTIVQIPNNFISEICTFKSEDRPLGTHFILHLNMTSNFISKLHKNCFKNMTSLRLLVLKSNKISVVFKGAFFSLISLIFLDVSNNCLRFLEPFLFADLKSLKFINISQHFHFDKISEETFLDLNEDLFLSTTEYHVCCFSRTLCSAHSTWPGNCHNIHFTHYFATLSLILTIILLFVSVASMLLNSMRETQTTVKRPKQSGHWYSTFALVSSTLFYALNNLSLLVQDKAYGPSYVVMTISERGSVVCALVGSFRLFFQTTSATSLAFLVACRCFLTVYPLQTRFKVAGYMRSFLIRKFAIVAVTVSLFSGMHILISEYHLLSMPLCSLIISEKQNSFSFITTVLVSVAYSLCAVLIATFSITMIVSFCNSSIQENSTQTLEREKQKISVAVNGGILVLVNVPSLMTFTTSILLFPFSQNLPFVLWAFLLVLPLSFILNHVVLNINNLCKLSCCEGGFVCTKKPNS